MPLALLLNVDLAIVATSFSLVHQSIEDFGPREEAAARELGKLVRQYQKPVLLQTVYARYDIPALRILREEGIPFYESIEITCRAMAALSEIGMFLVRDSTN